jgi:uncharacterized protein (DUF697 family)/tellurite resistance protein
MTALTSAERDAVSTLCLMAALADGRKDEAERGRLRSIYSSLDAGFSPERYERVLLGTADVEREAVRLGSDAVRALAYEMAVAVCDADGRADEAERAFLDRLRAALGLDAGTAAAVTAAGDALAEAPVEAPAPLASTDPAPVPDDASGAEAVEVGVAEPGGDLDPTILRYAVANGAFELLPQTLATLAVVPMQTKMVYRIGRHYGHELDAAKAKELLAAVGLGLTSQVVETYARGLLGGIAGKALGKPLGKKKGKKAKKVAKAAAGSAFQFAATYALGHAAKAYYAGGRRLGAGDLRALFDRQLEEGRALYETHRPAIERQAQTTDLQALLGQLQGGQGLLR